MVRFHCAWRNEEIAKFTVCWPSSVSVSQWTAVLTYHYAYAFTMRMPVDVRL